MVRIVGGFPPDNPDETRMGWAAALETDRAYYDIHPGRSLAGMGAASLAATIIAMGVQQSPEGIGFSWTQTFHNTYTTEDTAVTPPSHEVTRQTTGHPATPPETSQRMLSATALMPDVPSFDLSRTNEAQRLINGEEFSEFLTEARQMLAGGWTLSGYHVEGMSSDETELTDTAGLGTADPENVSLAKEYGNFVAGVFADQLAASGMQVPANAGSISSHEEVLTNDQHASVEQIRKANGFSTDKDLIAAYKAGPDKFSAYDRYTLKSLLDDNRGATVRMVFSRTAPGTPGTSETTVTDHCVITRKVVETNYTTTSRDKELIPIVVLPFIWARRRAKPGEAIKEPAPSLSETESDVSRVFRLIIGENGEIARVIEDESMGKLYPFPIRFAPDEIPAAPIPDETPAVLEAPVRPIAEEPRLPGYYGVRTTRRGLVRIKKDGWDYIRRDIDIAKWHPEADRREIYAGRLKRLADKLGLQDPEDLSAYVDRELLRRDRQQRRRRVALGIGGGILALAASTIRLDAGYCPNPDDYAAQSFRWNDFPDSMHLKFHIWGTNIDSPQFELWKSSCETPKASPRTHPVPAPAPTCDVRTVTIVDGKTVNTTETHYPGATTVTKVTP